MKRLLCLCTAVFMSMLVCPSIQAQAIIDSATGQDQEWAVGQFTGVVDIYYVYGLELTGTFTMTLDIPRSYGFIRTSAAQLRIIVDDQDALRWIKYDTMDVYCLGRTHVSMISNEERQARWLMRHASIAFNDGYGHCFYLTTADQGIDLLSSLEGKLLRSEFWYETSPAGKITMVINIYPDPCNLGYPQ